jgi:hypothetical protein
MKRHASQLSLILAAIAFAPAALAGSEIVKCIDPAGHVTLTDQPCGSNATAVRLTPAPGAVAAVAAGTEPEDGAYAAGAQPSTVERHVSTPSLLRQANWSTPLAPRSRPLARDVATLKAARQQLLMMDSAAQRQPQLAGLR